MRSVLSLVTRLAAMLAGAVRSALTQDQSAEAFHVLAVELAATR